jgi:long-chain acyl-CoA synthetase
LSPPRLHSLRALATPSKKQPISFLLSRWLTEAADQRGNAKALVYRDTYLSWRGLLHRVERRAQEFRAMGLGDGAWVGLMLGNVPDFVILALALSRVGAVIVPIDPTTATRELDLMLEAAPLRALITRPRGGPEAQAPDARAAAQPPLAKRDIAESRRRLQGTLLTCSVYKRDTPKIVEGTEIVLFTSDSAGDPKGVLRTSDNLKAEADKVKAALELDAEAKILAAVPLFHAYGFDFGLLAAMNTGAVLFLEDEIAPKRIAKILRDHAVDVVPGTPQLYAELAKIPTARPLKTKNARFLAAGAKLGEVTATAFHDKYGVRLISCYHTTETGFVALDRKGQSPDTVGKVSDVIELRMTPVVIPGSGEPAPAKTAAAKKAADKALAQCDEGVIWVRGKSVSVAAISPFAAPAVKPNAKHHQVQIGGRDADGYLRTGDIGKLDRSGRLVLLGREDDLVKVDGKRVALGEVEGCLESFPKVKAAQAMVITDPLAGPMVVARVVARGSVEAEEIIDHCARNLAPYKVPRRIEFCEVI